MCEPTEVAGEISSVPRSVRNKQGVLIHRGREERAEQREAIVVRCNLSIYLGNNMQGMTRTEWSWQLVEEHLRRPIGT